MFHVWMLQLNVGFTLPGPNRRTSLDGLKTRKDQHHLLFEILGKVGRCGDKRAGNSETQAQRERSTLRFEAFWPTFVGRIAQHN